MRQEMTGFWDGSGISWTICRQSAPCSRQMTTQTPHHSIFTGWMLFLTPNRQHQSTEGREKCNKKSSITVIICQPLRDSTSDETSQLCMSATPIGARESCCAGAHFGFRRHCPWTPTWSFSWHNNWRCKLAPPQRSMLSDDLRAASVKWHGISK